MHQLDCTFDGIFSHSEGLFLLNLQVKGVLVSLGLCCPLFVPVLTFMDVFCPPNSGASAIPDLVSMIPPPPSQQNLHLFSFRCPLGFVHLGEPSDAEMPSCSQSKV